MGEDGPGCGTWVAVLTFCAVVGLCGRLAEVSIYNDWDCLSKQCVHVPDTDTDGDGDASSDGLGARED